MSECVCERERERERQRERERERERERQRERERRRERVVKINKPEIHRQKQCGDIDTFCTNCH